LAEPAPDALIVAVSEGGEGGGRIPISWRLRPDLRFDPTRTAGRYQVRNLLSGERFELGEEEIFLCKALDDATGAEEIRSAFEKRFGLIIATEQLDQFYRDMAELGLLEPASPPAAADASNPETAEDDARTDTRNDERYDGYQWVWFNPHRAFTWLARRIGWLRYGAWLLVPGVPLALLIILYHRPEYQRALQAFSDPNSHLLFKFTLGLFVANLFTRIVQGVSVAYAGGTVNQFGLRLEFGVIPHFFVGKSIRAISRPPQQRLAAVGAALLTKLALFVGGMLVWRLTYQSGGTLSSYAFILGHLGLGAFLFIANPLWWGDGYVWLATWLKMPRLRDRAFQILKLYLRGRRPPEGLPALEKYALVGYIVASVAYVLLLLGMVALAKAVYLEKQYQGVGVILFLVLVGMVARWWLYRRAHQRQRTRERAEARAGTRDAPFVTGTARFAQRGATENKIGEPIESGPKRLRWPRLALLALLVTISFLPYPYDVTGDVTLFPTAYAEIHAVTSGMIVAVKARENQWVTPNQILAELSVWQQDRDIATTTADIERKQAELELLLHGPKAEAVEATREQLAMAQVRAAHSRKVQKLLEPVYRQGVVKDLEYEEAVKTAEVDQAGVAVATANLNLIKSPPLPMEVVAKQAELKQLREQLNYLREQRERTRLHAPVEGMIVTPRLEFKTGGFLKEGDLFATVEDNRIMRAEILAPETDIGEVQPDAPVRLRVWAYPLRDFAGRVASVAPVVEPSSADPFVRVVRVIVEIPNPDGLLKSQMTGVAKIAAGDKPFVVAFTRALVRFAMIEMWSWLP